MTTFRMAVVFNHLVTLALLICARSAADDTTTSQRPDADMKPAPFDDIILEPAGADYYDEFDYGDGNGTSDSTSFDPSTPYIRLQYPMRDRVIDLTRDADKDVIRIRCEVIGVPVPEFRWTRNNVPITDKRGRISIRQRSNYRSVLRIKRPEPLDTGYYGCEASNEAGRVEDEMILKVQNPPDVHRQGVDDQRSGFDSHPRPGVSHSLQPMENAVPRQGGRSGRCLPYTGTACAKFIPAHALVSVNDSNDVGLPDAEALLIRDQMLKSALSVIANSSDVTQECKVYAAKAACYHVFSYCRVDTVPMSVEQICRQDCIRLETELCPHEYALAAQQGLMESPLNILPDCAKLPNTKNCTPLQGETAVEPPKDRDLGKWSEVPCYHGSGVFYRGRAAVTVSDRHCVPWNMQDDVDVATHDELKGHNYCRNPDGATTRPYCYSDPAPGSNYPQRKEFCRIKQCGDGYMPALQAREAQWTREHKAPTSSTGIEWLFGPNSPSWLRYVYIGGGVGGLLMLMCLLITLMCYCRSRRRAFLSKTNASKHHHHHYHRSTLPANGAAHYTTAALSGEGTVLSYMNGTPGHQLRTPLLSQQQNGTTLSSASDNHNQQAVEMSGLLSAPPPSDYYSGSQLGGVPQYRNIQPPPSLAEISPHSVVFEEELGSGQFGKVFKGQLYGFSMSADGSSSSIPVAVKLLRDDAAPNDVNDFRREAELMARFRHPNIVELLGACMQSRPNFMVFEYMMHGDLHEFLLLRSPYRSSPGGGAITLSSAQTPLSADSGCQLAGLDVDEQQLRLDHGDFMHIATQVSAGMDYLASHHFVHRDLACRNCLVSDHLVIKIADFGLSRDIYAADYYKAASKAPLPVRWMPPEAIVYGKFSEETDVWSFGVLLWEIYAYGRQPFETYSNQDVIEMVRNGCLLQCPPQCPPRIYSLMVECWSQVPARRPAFSEIHHRLQTWSLAMQSSTAPSASGFTTSPPPESSLYGLTPSRDHPPYRRQPGKRGDHSSSASSATSSSLSSSHPRHFPAQLHPTQRFNGLPPPPAPRSPYSNNRQSPLSVRRPLHTAPMLTPTAIPTSSCGEPA